jgi:hypothetical protein
MIMFSSVTAVCGDFYIGGRQFDSLQDLIGYYTHKSDLLKHERLVVPVPPPEPVSYFDTSRHDSLTSKGFCRIV